MARRITKGSPGMRLQLGASVLSAARAVDTSLVKDRLARFERVHRTYVTAQRRVDAAETALRAAQARLAECDAIQDEAVEILARALVADGQPRGNPFDTFGAPAPGTLMRLPFTEETEAVHRLVAAIQRSKGASPATLEAAQAGDKAAAAVAQAMAPVEKLQEGVRDARRTRDAVAQGWESALAALRRGARAAADEGAPDLYPTLFPAVGRTTTKTKTTDDEPPTATDTSTAA
jgi:hypothetical protein